MIDTLILLWIGFSLGFFFSFTTIGKTISLTLLSELDKYLPKKDDAR